MCFVIDFGEEKKETAKISHKSIVVVLVGGRGHNFIHHKIYSVNKLPIRAAHFQPNTEDTIDVENNVEIMGQFIYTYYIQIRRN